MKIYLLETDVYNEVVFVEGDKAKVTETAPSGKFEGIDLYGCGAIEALKALFSDLDSHRELNGFNEIEGEMIATDSLDEDELTLILRTTS